MGRRLKSLWVLAVIPVALALGGCPEGTADKSESKAVEQQQQHYVTAQPLPQFDFSLERDAVIQLYRLRNKNVATHTVWRGGLSNVEGDCPSVGYPIPYDTSLTNPLTVGAKGHNYGYAIVEQPEANGLFPSKNSIATWVRCIIKDGDRVTIVPVYVEGAVTAYPYPVSVDYASSRVQPDGKATVTLKSKSE